MEVKETWQSSLNMIFILGVVLLIVSFALIVITEDVTRYQNVMGFSIPYKTTIHPYQDVGGFVLLFSIILIGVSIYSKFKK